MPRWCGVCMSDKPKSKRKIFHKKLRRAVKLYNEWCPIGNELEMEEIEETLLFAQFGNLLSSDLLSWVDRNELDLQYIKKKLLCAQFGIFSTEELLSWLRRNADSFADCHRRIVNQRQTHFKITIEIK